MFQTYAVGLVKPKEKDKQMMTTNPKRPDIKLFRKQTENLTRHQRHLIAQELISGVQERLTGVEKRLIPDQIRKEMDFQIGKALKKRNPRFTWRCLFKMYLVSDYPAQELQHWVMTAGQVHRQKNAHAHKATKYTRRPSIYDPNGNVVPRTFIDRHLPKWIESQREYDRYMKDRRAEKTVEIKKYHKKRDELEKKLDISREKYRSRKED